MSALVAYVAYGFSLFLQVGGALPAECTFVEGNNVWERAKTPALRRYCDLLASGASKLAGGASMAGDVVVIANEAERMVPGRPAPVLLRGRALSRLGHFAEAYNDLKAARARDARALDDPLALLAWGRASAQTGHLADAREAYRALLPRAAGLAAAERGTAYLEAGLLAMAQGPSGLDEAISIFRQARHDAQDIAQAVAMVALSLALDRSGARDEARALLAERGKQDPMPMLIEARTQKLVVPALFDREMDALSAIALEAFDPGAAREAWHKYVEAAATGVWADHARQHEASLSGKRSVKSK